MDLICVSFSGRESSEKIATPPRLTGKTQMLETEQKRIPKRGATTSVLNVVTNITTAKKASPVLSTKPRPSAPVIGDSADMGEGE